MLSMLLLDFPSIESVPETTEDSMDEYEAGLMVPRGENVYWLNLSKMGKIL